MQLFDSVTGQSSRLAGLQGVRSTITGILYRVPLVMNVLVKYDFFYRLFIALG
jgi:hypothetical protein